ncbi:MAG TPA: tetratricopeptide repeat protein [Candidatus Eisenbacteria bacterium]|nr:tetratricopeptide repeat protein [Candidatus Eisenbacteria bacterium]
MRFWGVADRLPDPTLGINVLDDSVVEETDRTTTGRAWTMWGGGTKKLDLNPHTGGWPGFSFYLTLGIQKAYHLTYLASHPGATAAEFANDVKARSDRFFLFGRIASLLIGALTVYLTYRLGARLAGRSAGALAACFLALNPLHILTSQHIADPNLLALLFVLLAALAMVRIVEERGFAAGARQGGAAPARGGEPTLQTAAIAGAMIGFAGACKYVPLVLALPLAVAHGRSFLRSRAFYVSMIAIVVALFLASPYTFLDWKTTLKDIQTQRSALFSDWVGQTAFPFSLPTYLAVSLPHAMGWPAYLLGLVGMGYLWRRGAAARPIALLPATIVLANGALKAAQERYVLVAIPILFLGTALTILELASWARARWGARVPGPAPMAAAGLIALVGLAWPLPEYAGLRRELAKPDTRHASRKWILANIPTDRPMVVELYGPVFTQEERSVVIMPFFATRVPMVRPAYHPELLDGAEYYVSSGEISRRFDAAAANYPVESGYYRWLRENAPVVWSASPESTSGPRVEVRRLPKEISTRAERDSIWARALPQPTGVSRLALYTVDFANMFGRLGHHDRAEEWALRGLQVRAATMTVRLLTVLAYSRLQSRDFEGALAAAHDGVARAPRDPRIRMYLGFALKELGRHEEARREFEAGYSLTQDPRFLMHLGTLFSEMGRSEDAVGMYSRVPQSHPDRYGAMREMSLLLINVLGRPEEGLEALREAARLAPDPEQARAIQEEAARIEGILVARGMGAGGRGTR